ncbi:MAG: carboxypeptidase-like regulatory domain-containing protein, partial [Planctomycetota bacterium]
LAEVTTATGTEPFQLWAAATANGRRITLPMQQGTRVRLPAGSYEVWTNSQDGWTWQRLELASGARTLLQFQGPAQRVRRRDQAHVHPDRWCGIDLFLGDRDECVLLGAALATPLVAHVPRTGCVAIGVVPGPPSREPVLWPPVMEAPSLARLHVDAEGDAAAGALMYSLRRTDSDGWRLLGSGQAGQDGSFVLPRPESGDDWLLVVSAKHPPRALPWTQVRDEHRITLQRGLPLVVNATTRSGEPAVDLRLEYVPDGAEVATLATHTDGRGSAHLPLLVAPGELRVSDERFLNQEIAVEAVPHDGVRLVVEAGERLRGRALLPDGSVAAGVLVTVRDPRGLLRPASRATTTAADGSFTFSGLPEAMDLVLFATTRRDAHTWSGRMASVRAGGEGVELTLRDEDPQLGPPRK